jgi:hypothetical protein
MSDCITYFLYYILFYMYKLLLHNFSAFIRSTRDFSFYPYNNHVFLMWCWRRMEKISCTDFLKNEEVLHRVKEEKNIIRTVRLTELVTSCGGTAF